MTDPISQPLTPAAWNERYKAKDTPWDLSGPTPEFVRLLDEGVLLSEGLAKGRALVPGGGRGHDAILFAQRGYEVDLVDFASDAIEAALIEASRQKAVVHAYCRNFFELPNEGYHQGTYELLVEYTFFCAISPDERARYANAAAALIKPGGMLVGLFFPTAIDKAGPPFQVSQAEVVKLFSPRFEVRIEMPQRSVKPREGREFLGLFKRKEPATLAGSRAPRARSRTCRADACASAGAGIPPPLGSYRSPAPRPWRRTSGT